MKLEELHLLDLAEIRKRLRQTWQGPIVPEMAAAAKQAALQHIAIAAGVLQSYNQPTQLTGGPGDPVLQLGGDFGLATVRYYPNVMGRRAGFFVQNLQVGTTHNRYERLDFEYDPILRDWVGEVDPEDGRVRAPARIIVVALITIIEGQRPKEG